MERGGRISVKQSPNCGHRAWELSGVFTGGNRNAINSSPEHTVPAMAQDTLMGNSSSPRANAAFGMHGSSSLTFLKPFVLLKTFVSFF